MVEIAPCCESTIICDRCQDSGDGGCVKIGRPAGAAFYAQEKTSSFHAREHCERKVPATGL